MDDKIKRTEEVTESYIDSVNIRTAAVYGNLEIRHKINSGAAASHLSILEKLRQRDAGGAELAMQGVISRGKDELEALLELLKDSKKGAE